MKYSEEEVLQYVQEDDVKFIRITFCDVFGRQKNISIMPNELPRAFAQGIPQKHSLPGLESVGRGGRSRNKGDGATKGKTPRA